MYWKTRPTTYRVGETTKPYGDDSGRERDASTLKETGVRASYYPKRSEGTAALEDKLLEDAEATAREYCRRRNSGKWGLRKI